MIRSVTHKKQIIPLDLAEFLIEVKEKAARLKVRMQAGKLDHFDQLELLAFEMLLKDYGIDLDLYVSNYYELYIK